MSRGEAPGKKPNSSGVSLKFVDTQVVQPDSLSLRIESFGRLRSFRDVNLSAEVQGRLLEGDILLKEGASFKKGSVIFRIDASDIQLSLLSRRSNFISLVAQALPDLKIDIPDAFPRWESFYQQLDVNGSLPALPDFKSAKEKTYVASRNLLSEYYSIQSDETRLGKYVIRASFNGSIAEVFAEPGAVVNPGSNIARVVQDDLLEVQIPVTAEDIHLINPGTKVRLNTTENEFVGEATVSRFSKVIDANTQTIDVYATLQPQGERMLYDGMYVKALLYAGTRDALIELPRRAVFNENRVYLLTDSSLVETPVQLVKKNTETILVSGIPAGSHVVIEPVTSFGPNQKFVPLQKQRS